MNIIDLKLDTAATDREVKKLHPNELDSARKLFSCPICLDDCSDATITKPLDCNHRFCHTCLVEYFKARINSFKVLNIPCPYAGCTQIFTEQAIQQVLDKNTFQMYQKAALKKVLNRDPGTKFCPEAGCSRQFKPQSSSAFTKCKCGTRICNICCNPWHEGKTCLQAIDSDFELYAKEKDVKFCIMCKTYVLRVEGCKHITCPICDYEWCWDCGREYKSQHQLDCIGMWSPTPPQVPSMAKWQWEWWNSSNIKKLGLLLGAILLSPFILFGFLMLWPLWIYFDPKTALSTQTPFKSCGTVALSIILAILLAPMVCIIGFVMLLAFIIIYPWTIDWSEVFKNYKTQKKQIIPEKRKRWTKRDPLSFTYTPDSKPDVNIHVMTTAGNLVTQQDEEAQRDIGRTRTQRIHVIHNTQASVSNVILHTTANENTIRQIRQIWDRPVSPKIQFY